MGLVARRDVLEGALAAADDAAVPVDHCAVGEEHGLAAARAPRTRNKSLSRLAGADAAGGQREGDGTPWRRARRREAAAVAAGERKGGGSGQEGAECVDRGG